MDPVSVVVAAVALGASIGLTETATTAVKDAYAGLKTLLRRRDIGISGLERQPDSRTQRDALTETLTETPGIIDDELLAAAQRLTDAIADDHPGVGSAIGVDLRDVQAEFLRIRSIRSLDGGVRAERITVAGGIDIGDISAGATTPAEAKTDRGASNPSGR